MYTNLIVLKGAFFLFTLFVIKLHDKLHGFGLIGERCNVNLLHVDILKLLCFHVYRQVLTVWTVMNKKRYILTSSELIEIWAAGEAWWQIVSHVSEKYSCSYVLKTFRVFFCLHLTMEKFKMEQWVSAYLSTPLHFPSSLCPDFLYERHFTFLFPDIAFKILSRT